MLLELVIKKSMATHNHTLLIDHTMIKIIRMYVYARYYKVILNIQFHNEILASSTVYSNSFVLVINCIDSIMKNVQ